MPEKTPTGYLGKILRVNLSDKSISIEKPDDKFYRRYFGGTALFGYYLLKELRPGIDPLGPENKLIFSSGIISGLPFAGSARSAVGAKSPLTGGWGDGQCGGFWPTELKRAGWDAIIIEGQSDKPVYLWINDDKVEIRDASHIWGKPTKEAQEQIRDELGDTRVRVAQIGPAGEKMVRLACILNDLCHAYGRSGLGAVMGSKKLRAIAVRGSQTVPLANAEKVREIAKQLTESIKIKCKPMTEHGTSGTLHANHGAGMLPTRNFQEGQFESYLDIDGATMTQTILTGRGNCYACSVHCKREVKVGPPYNVDPIYGGPEYETMAAFGSLCGINDLKAISQANQICNAYGLDTIGAGVTIAFAMECFERGILTKKDTGGIELKFGNAEAMLNILEMMAERKGLGNLLAEGSKKAAEKIGHGAIEYAMQIKGQELPMHDPRGKIGMGMGYATSPTGAEHMRNMHDPMFELEGGPLEGMRDLGVLDPLPLFDLNPAKVRLFQYVMHWQNFGDCAIFCYFVPLSHSQVVELVNAATGWTTSLFELMKVGERAMNLARLFNAREGFTAKDDIIPERLYHALNNGPLKDRTIDKETMHRSIQTFYKMAEWDPERAAPTVEKLQELDLGWAVDCLRYPDKIVTKKI